MIKMATGEGLPPLAGCRNGSRLVFSGYGGFWRRNSRSRFLSGSFGLYKRCCSREQGRVSPGCPRGRGARPGGWARPPPSWAARDSSGPTLALQGLLLVHTNSLKIGTSIGLHLVSLFCKTQKQGENRKLALGSRLIG